MRIVLITLILSIFGYQAQAQIQKANPLKDKILGAKAKAISVMREYSENEAYDSDIRKAARLMADLLEKASTAPAVGKTVYYCNKNPGVVADTDWVSQVISLCPRGLSSTREDLIQTFIHEAYHLYEWKYYIPEHFPKFYKKLMLDPNVILDYPDFSEDCERRAATIELEIMLKTYKCVYSVTTYFKDLLGLNKGRDYFICK